MEDMDKLIAEWKKEHGSVYVLNIGGSDFYFRTLTRDDYIAIMQQSASGIVVDPELQTVKQCVLNDVPEDIYISKGGLATVIYEKIMEKSGFVTVEAEEL
jgi:hypothetical protein